MANGSGGPEGSDGPAGHESSKNRQLDELTRAYERARDELNEAVRTLRAELAKIDLEQARARARTWIDENPTLAVFLGVGAGILAGRLLSSAFRPEPPPVSVRARKRADRWIGEAGDYAGELSTALAYHLGKAAKAAGEAGDYVAHHGADVADRVARRARQAGEDLSRRAEHLGHEFSHRASVAGRDVSKRTEDAAHALAASTSRSVHELEEAAEDLAKTLKKKSKAVRKKVGKGGSNSHGLPDTALSAAQAALAATVVKKVNDWMKASR